MNRVTSGAFREVIAAGIEAIPPGLSWRLRHVDFLTGVDPVWAGLHTFRNTDDGRHYSDTAHCSLRHHSSDRTTTIVLPVMTDPGVIVHELGHALDESLGWSHDAQPVTPYGSTSRSEAFAESFRAWLYWYGDQDIFMRDQATRALFASLSEATQ